MITPQFVLPIAPELVVDLFAGGGGASTGIEQAIGRHVDIAINHDPEAVALHQANHPQTRHFVSDVFEVDPVTVTDGLPVGLLWASPDCKHFSKAKGGKPVSKKIRSLAWIVVKWAKAVRPRMIMLENVEEFQTWGPLAADGRPCPERKGKTFARWKRSLEQLGYVVEHRELRACDYGAPTIRKRLFLVARRDGLPIVWPEATHGKPGTLPVKQRKLKPWRTAAECIDFSLPCPSIFERDRPLADATCRRIAKGIMRYVVEAAEPFIVNTANSKTTGRGPNTWTGQEPLRTVTSAPGFAVVAPHITKYHGESAGSAGDSPFPTITAGSFIKRPGGNPPMALASATLAPFITEHANASNQRNMPADEPLRTQCAEVKGGHFAIVAPTLIQTGYGEREGQAPRAPGLDVPLGTVVAAGAKHAVVSAFLAKHYGGVVGHGVDQPTGTVTATDHHSLVTAQLVGVGGRAGQSRPRSADEPAATLTAKADTALLTSNLVKLRGDNVGSGTDEPLHTVSAQGTHHGEVRAFLVKYYGNEEDGVPVTEPMHTIPTRDRFGLVTIKGETFAITDIGLRMLTPRELYRAQGFPDSYIIDHGGDGRALTKTAQVRMCGNSVCPPLSRAIVASNYAEPGVARKAA